MLYYLGKGTEFKKEECKEYKTIDGALKAAAKDEEFVVWDENGNAVGSLTNNVPSGALNTNPDGSVPVFNADGTPAGTVDAATVAAVTGNAPQDDEQTPQSDGNNAGQTNTPSTDENGQNGANTSDEDNKNASGQTKDAQDDEQNVIIPQGKMKVTVICDGALNLRRSAAWGNGNICGRAVRGQTYYVKAIHAVAGKKMVETIDGIFLSGMSEHVQFEQL